MEPHRDADIRELYANAFQVGYNVAEFLLDFGREFEDTESRYFWRIITTPVQVKVLLRLLEDAVRSYEEQCGTIPEDLTS